MNLCFATVQQMCATMHHHLSTRRQLQHSATLSIITNYLYTYLLVYVPISIHFVQCLLVSVLLASTVCLNLPRFCSSLQLCRLSTSSSFAMKEKRKLYVLLGVMTKVVLLLSLLFLFALLPCFLSLLTALVLWHVHYSRNILSYDSGACCYNSPSPIAFQHSLTFPF